MLKLVRVALTAAILVALGVRLRRRAQRTTPPTPPPAPRPVEIQKKKGIWVAWVAIAGAVAVALIIELVPTPAQVKAEEARARLQAQQTTPPSAPATPSEPPYVPVEPDPTPHALGVQDTCTPVRRPVKIRPIDPVVKRQVNVEWRRIERWLKANAPKSYRELSRPGRARTIAIAESQMGLDFPDGMRASLLRHNGPAMLPGGAALTVREIRDTWRRLCRENEPWWVPGAIPVRVRSDDSIDVAAPDTAAIINLDVSEGGIESITADSFTELLRETADALEFGADDFWRPQVKRGRLTWD